MTLSDGRTLANLEAQDFTNSQIYKGLEMLPLSEYRMVLAKNIYHLS